VNYFELEGFKIITEHKWVQKNIDLNETFGNNSAEFMLSPGLYYINSMDSVYSKME
jgi:hypothetical protein